MSERRRWIMPWIRHFLLNRTIIPLAVALSVIAGLSLALLIQSALSEERSLSSPLPPPPGKVAVRPPEAPRSCRIPRGALLVSNVDQLQAALAASVAQDIRLADGTYSSSSFLAPKAAHRVWGSHAGNVTLRAGLNLGSKWDEISGFEIHCLTLEVTDASLVHNN